MTYNSTIIKLSLVFWDDDVLTHGHTTIRVTPNITKIVTINYLLERFTICNCPISTGENHSDTSEKKNHCNRNT